MNDTNSLAISTRDLHKRFGNGAGVEALRGVDFQARFAELTFIVGPSGCGKTTLLSVITGLLDPTAGEVELFGERPGELPSSDQILFRRKNLGFVFQQYNLLPALTFGIFSVVRSQPQHEATVPPSSPAISPYSYTVAAVGLVEASSEDIAIGTPLADVVAEVFVTGGQSVKAGDPLFRLDGRQRRADLGARQADLRVAGSQVKVNAALLDDVTRQLRFAEDLPDKRAISAEDLARRRSAVEIAQARIDEAKARVAAAAAQVKMIETQIDRSIVRAPVDGTALQVKIHPGEFAPVGVTPAPLVLLGRVKPLHIRVDVDEHEAWRVRAEAKAPPPFVATPC